MKFLIVIMLMFIGLLRDSTYCSGDELKENDGVWDCYGVSCPDGTVTCTKHCATSDDSQYIDTVVRCIDNQGNTLKSDHRQSDNPFPGVQFSIMSWNYGDTREVSDATSAYDNKNNQVETF